MRISVVIPLYNKKDYVLSTLKSVFNQTVQPEEIIIVNDGSTDGSEKVIQSLGHPLVRLIDQPNRGVSSARNKGIEESKGDWIALLDADDFWESGYLEKIQMLTYTYPICNVLVTAYRTEDFFGVRKLPVIRNLHITREHGILDNYFEIASCSNPPLCSSAIVVKKEAILSVGGFPEGVKVGEDLLTWAKLAVRYKIAYSKDVLAVVVQDPSHSVSEIPSRLPDENDFVGQGLGKIYLESEGKLKRDIRNYLSLWYKMRASVYLRNSNRLKVLINSFKSLKYNPFNYKNYLFLLLSCFPYKILKVVARIYSS